MAIEYDDKGKFYTDVITKVPVSALIQTTTHLIRGHVHVRKGDRLKDELERDEAFLAVTHLTVLGAGEEPLYSAPFMAIRRAQIVWVLPTDADHEEASA